MHGFELDLPGFAPRTFLCYLGDHGPVTMPLWASVSLDSRPRWSLYLHHVTVQME